MGINDYRLNSIRLNLFHDKSVINRCDAAANYTAFHTDITLSGTAADKDTHQHAD